jgi:flagellum-specific peptidoglycan hydrolase FlgJ
MDARFKNFPSLDACVSYLVDRWYKDYKGYTGVNRAFTPTECAQLLVREGYATDPAYADKLIRILREHD